MRKTAAFLAVFAICGQAQAQEPGSVQDGLRLARTQCSECHRVDRTGRSPKPDAPSFEEIADTPGMTRTALLAALRTSHATMPNIIIKDSDVDDLVAYILSLKGND